MRSIHKKLMLGIACIVVSYAGLLYSGYTVFTSLLIGALFYEGVILISDYIVQKAGVVSVRALMRRNRKEILSFLLFGAVTGMLMNLVLSELGGLWYFPYWSTTVYILFGFILGGWAFYILSALMGYQAAKVLLDHMVPFKSNGSLARFESPLHFLLLVAGLCCVAIVMREALVNTAFFSDFVYVINAPKEPYLSWPYWIISFVGAYCICEYVAYIRKRTSLLSATLRGYLNPLMAVIGAAFFLALTNEVQNFGPNLWRYANYPVPDVTVLHVPLFIILAWPLHMIVFIAAWRAWGPATSRVLFDPPGTSDTTRLEQLSDR